MAWLTGYTYRKKITTQFVNVDDTLADFPILVRFDDDADLADALATGFDIRFTQSDGETLLKYERQSWSGGGASNVTAIFWVKIPSISAVAGTEFYVYWKKSDAGDGEDAPNVWDSNFKGVWHLEDLTDSTGNSHDLTAVNGPTSGQTGKVGNCYLFNDADIEYLTIAENCDIGANGFPCTISTWCKTDVDSILEVLASLQNTSAGIQRHLHYLAGHAGGDPARILSGTSAYANTTTGFSTNTWHHITTMVAAANSRAVFIDGGSKGTNTGSLTPTGIDRFSIGSSGNSADYSPFSGYIDEVRLSNIVRSDAWIHFEFHNIAEADHELDWGTKESSGGETHEVPVSDSLGATDALGISAGKARSLAATAGLDDAISFAAASCRGLSEASGLSDAVQVAVARPLLVGDTAGIADSASASLAGVHSRQLSDTAGLSDSVARAVAHSRLVVDTAGLADDCFVSVTAGGETYEAEGDGTLGATDNLAVACVAARVTGDTAGIGDSVSVAVARAVVVSDAAGLADAASRSVVACRQVTDDLGASDALSPAAGHACSVSDDLGATDATAAAAARARLIADAFGASDGADAAILFARLIQDSAGLSDSAARIAAFRRTLIETAGLADNVDLASKHLRQTADTAGLGDFLKVVLNAKLAETADTLGASDAVIVQRFIGISTLSPTFKQRHHIRYAHRRCVTARRTKTIV